MFVIKMGHILNRTSIYTWTNKPFIIGYALVEIVSCQCIRNFNTFNFIIELELPDRIFVNTIFEFHIVTLDNTAVNHHLSKIFVDKYLSHSSSVGISNASVIFLLMINHLFKKIIIIDILSICNIILI